jgi:hypothetical protein
LLRDKRIVVVATEQVQQAVSQDIITPLSCLSVIAWSDTLHYFRIFPMLW